MHLIVADPQAIVGYGEADNMIGEGLATGVASRGGK